MQFVMTLIKWKQLLFIINCLKLLMIATLIFNLSEIWCETINSQMSGLFVDLLSMVISIRFP